MKTITILAAATFAVAALPAFASASDTGEWQVTQSSDTGQVITISSGSGDAHGAYFSCSGDKLKVGVGIVPGDVQNLLAASSSTRVRTHNVTITLGDESMKSDWTYYPGRKVAFGKDNATARKFYNAAVRGDAVSFKMPFKDEVNLTFPEVNGAFTSFANDCPVTNPGNQ